VDSVRISNARRPKYEIGVAYKPMKHDFGIISVEGSLKPQVADAKAKVT
jgi:hypothetical protein